MTLFTLPAMPSFSNSCRVFRRKGADSSALTGPCQQPLIHNPAHPIGGLDFPPAVPHIGAIGGSPPPVSRYTGNPEEPQPRERSEEHTSELQSLMRTSYAVF